MENKSNSLNRIKRQQREKVLRFSIRKYSFGAASVAVAALMFLGARVASADAVDAKNQPTIGAPNPNEEKSPLIEPAPTAKNGETKETEKVEVAKETEEREKSSENKEAVEANSLTNGTSTSTITVTKDASGDKVTEKQTLDKSQLQASITKVQELLDKVNKEKALASTLAAIQADLEAANSVLNNNSLELTQAEVDAAAKKLNEKISVLSSMPKANAPEKVVKEGKNTIANTGTRDSRNGNKIEEGTNVRAASISSTWDSSDNLLIYQRHRASDGNRVVRNGLTEYTEKKVDLFAKTTTIGGNRYVVYDVFFNNDGRAMANQSYNQIYRLILPPQILDLNTGSRNFGTYKTDTMRDLKFDVYRRNGDTGTLSQNPEKFTKVDSQNFDFLRDSVSKGHLTYFNTLDIRHGASYNQDMRETFRGNSNDPLLTYGITRTDTRYNQYSYGIGIKTNDKDKAVHMHVKVKLKQGVTDEQVRDAFTLAVAGTYGLTTNQAYTFVSGKDANEPKYTDYPDQPVQPTLREKQAKLYPIQGSTYNKTVGDTLPNPDNPVSAKYITPKNGGEFPGGMTWSWKNNIKPSTAEAGVFQYTAVATYQDGSKSDAANSGSDGTVTLNVKPIKPTITASDVQHKKGLTNQTITVNVGTGVKNGSTVTLYDGNNVIGKGTTNGTTARITVSSALPGRPITAVTTVNNNGTVTSDKSEGVTPTDAPDNQPPTVKLTNPTDGNRVSVLTSNETNAPTTRIYRGATLNIPLSMYDNDPKGKVNLKYVSGLPKGVNFNNGTTLSKTGAVEKTPGITNVTGKVAADATLGKQTVTFKVSDDQGNNVDSGNKATVKFNVEVLDLAFKEGKGTVSDGKLVVKTAKGTSYTDSHDFITATNGTSAGDGFFPGGMKFRFIDSNGTTTSKVTLNTPGKHNVKAAAYFHDGYAGTNGVEKVTNNTPGKDNEIINRSFLYKTIEFQVKPTAPTVTPETNGDVTVTPVTEENVNTFNFTYNDPNNTPKTVTATKTGNRWTLTNAPADGVTIDQTTGKVTIKDRAIKDSIPVTAISKTTDNVESDPSRANSNVGDNEPPKFKFTPNGKETRVETGGEQVAYITPTEDTNLKIGTVTDNSGKLSEVKFADKANRVFGIQGLGSGITYNEVAKTNNGDVDAPRDIVVTGKLPARNGNAAWTDDVAITRFVVAKDAALKEMRDQTENVSNPTRVKLKVLTQATKYDPHVGNQVIDKDITAPGAKVTPTEFEAIKSNITFTSDRGDVKISNGANNRTAGLNITMKDNGAIQKDSANGSYYVNAKIEYPDGSTEDIRIPVAKSDTTAPRVTINGKELSETATDYSFVVFKGSKFNPTLRVSDDKNNVKSVSVSGLPSGNDFSATGNWAKTGADVQVTGDTITATNTATLGDHEASIVVKDALNNEKTYKFKYKVVDVAIKETPKTVPLNTQLGDPHNYVKVVDGTNNDGDDKYYPDGMSFKWKKGTAEVANGTRLSRPGIVSDYKPEVKFKSGAGFYTKTIDGKEVKVYTPATIERDQTFRVKPTAPTITPLEKGDVTVTPVSEENVNTLNFTYKHPNDSTITVTATKNGNRWSLTSGAPGDGVTIDPNTGVVTIKDRAIKDATEVTAKSVTTDSVDSDTTTANSKAGDKEPPVFTFVPDEKEKVVDATGRQVVYVTPTEETDLNIGVVTDNSGKLVQAIFRETNGNTSSGLGFPGLNHNGLPRTDNVEVDAPRNILVTGKVSEYKTGTTPWADTDEFTRGMYARDAATNEIRNTPEHPTNVVFKVLTQATKYVPQVSAQPVNVDVNATSVKITQSDFDALKSNITFDSTRGPVKIDNTTTGLKISMKEEGAIKQNADGSHYVGATIEYPDHSIDEIQIPVVKADANEPSATMDSMLLTKDENTTANFVVFKGAKFNPTFNVRDDRNKITNLKVTGLPNGTEIEKTGSWTSGTNVKIEDTANTSTDTATLGDHVGSVEVTDSTGNKGTYKYKYKVVDVEVRNSPKTVELGTKLVDAANANNGQDSHNFVKVVDGQNNDGDDKYYPAGMNFKWSTNNAEITTTTEFNKPGVVTDYKALVKFSSGAGYYTKSIDGKTVKVYTPASIQKEVTFHVAPPKPTFNQDTVSSTTRTISGTLGGFTLDNNNDRVVEVHLNDKDNTVLSSKNGQVTINGDTWTATLPDDVKLRQSENKNGETTQPTQITVVNKVGDTNVSKTSDPKVVTMGDYSPSATIAGSKHIDVTVPHDAKRLELRFHNSADTDNKPNSIVLVRDENGGKWKVDSSTSPAGVTSANSFVQGITNSINDANKSENKVSITLKETANNKKLLIKEEESGDNTANYTSGLGLRIDYKPEAGSDATPVGNWQVISVTNDAPVVTLKDATVGTQENPKIYEGVTKLTADKLKELVKVSDTEDDSTTDKPFGTGKVNVLSGLPENPTAGVYAVTLQPVDSQGKVGNQVTVHVVVKEEKPAAPTISQWQNGNVKVTPSTDNGGYKVTIPLSNGSVTLVKKDTGWEIETPKEGVVFHNGSLEIPKDLVGTSITAKSTKGSGGSAVDSDDATYSPKSHTVTKVDIVKEADSPLSRDDLSGTTGVTGVTDGTETKDFTASKITSVVEKTSPLPNVTPDSKQTVPVTITYEDGSTETTDVVVKVKPSIPTVTPKENGSVEITPVLTGEGTTTITYTGEDNTPQIVTVTKGGDGTWTSSDPTIAVDANGKVTIPADKVKDGSPVTAQVTSKLTGLPSQPTTVTVGKPLEVKFGEPEKAIENKAYTSAIVVTPNKSNSTITAPTVNGLTVNSEGKVTGTPEITDWDGIEEHRDVTIKVTVEHDGDNPVEKDVVVNVLRDTDGDGEPDITDKDDDNDGIPDEEEKKNGTDPKVPTTQTPTIGITRKENGDAIVTPTKSGRGTYPPGTTVTIPGNDNTPIEVTIGNDGSGTVPNDKLPKTDKPGTGTVTEPNKAPSKPVEVTTPARKTPIVELEQDPDTGEVTVTPKKPDGTLYPENTKVEIPGKDKDHPITVTIGKDGKGKVPNSELPEGKVPGTGKITVPGKPAVEVPNVETPGKIIPGAPTTEQPVDIEITRKPNGDAVVTPKKQDKKPYPSGTKVEIPGEDKDGNPITITVTIGDNGSGEVPNDNLPKKAVPGTGTVTEPNKNPSQPVKVTTPARKTPTLDVDQDPDTGEVTVTPKKPDGTLYPENTKVEIPGKDKDHPITITIGKDGTGKVPNSELPEGKVPGTGKITVPGKPAVEVPNVTTPSKVTPTVELDQDPDTGEVTVTPKKPDGTLYPENTKVEIPGKDKDHPITVTIGKEGKGKVPNSELPEGKVPGTSKITVPGKPAVEVPNVTTPSKVTPTVELDQDPDTGEVTVTPKKPDGTLYPENTKVEIPGKDKDHPITITIGKDGTGKVPNSELPEGKVPGTGKITVPGKPAVEVPNVTTPAKVTPETPETEKPVEIEITPQPNGDAIVTPKKPGGGTYPPGTKVEIPGEDGNTITVEIGKDGSGEVPNDKLPKKAVPGTGTVTEPNKKPSQPVNVTTPARKTPTIELKPDPKTGDVTVTPQRPGGGTYPPGTTVEIPGEDGNTITVEIGKDGSGKVPNDKLPKKAVPGTGKITEPGQPAVEVPNVTTPAKVTPETPETEKPVEIEITPQPNGDAIVTPKKPGGGTYPPGTKVEIPGEDGNTITVEIGKDGSGEVPNDKLPKKAVPGTGTVTEPNKKPSQPVNVITPARKTPTVDVEQDPKTGDVTVTPKKPDESTYPPGTKVEIPGKDGNPITVTIGEDGKGKVPNSDLPEGKVPGTAKITEPGQPAVEVPVETPARKTPTVDVEQDPKTGDVTVTPKKPDGSTYPPGTKVEIPGKDGNPITVTIGEDGKGKVPNSELPDGKVPGTAKITEPGKPTVEVPVETPAKVIAENGELPGPITLPELTIEVRWIDENGNVLKPSVETGNEKDAEHGTIPGYEFVRTMIDENEPVMTHIFRKVSGTTNTNPVAPVTPATPVKPDTNGGSGQDTPAPTPAPTTPIPDAVTPNADQVDTQTTVDNGANSNDSQNVLPNTGTESNAALASLGLLGLLSGFGLVARKKKED
ncbi:hypothetical protein CYK19_04575 [Streptococcus mitis]|uniref:Gram-positive cocci surface proteins LPxTG domain-containing protein n=2 Tax=Streptococcus TaxID=1301 RepID=A0A2N6P5Q5_STROR|nr:MULTISPECIES: YSIRK-type signal peptide-containing protein [Streptococcus]PKZ98732.1 hypothetical protein CYK19_04575 [Streptococcus mitis]PMB86037.1 hypothetical protein CK799_04575 [Streptococcus oralis subsp. dentisani]